MYRVWSIHDLLSQAGTDDIEDALNVSQVARFGDLISVGYDSNGQPRTFVFKAAQ